MFTFGFVGWWIEDVSFSGEGKCHVRWCAWYMWTRGEGWTNGRFGGFLTRSWQEASGNVTLCDLAWGTRDADVAGRGRGHNDDGRPVIVENKNQHHVP